MSDSKRLAADLAAITAKVREQLAIANTPKVKVEMITVSVAASKAVLGAAKKAAQKSFQRERGR